MLDKIEKRKINYECDTERLEKQSTINSKDMLFHIHQILHINEFNFLQI